MNGLSIGECQTWLASTGFVLNRDRRPDPKTWPQHHSLYYLIGDRQFDLPEFSRRLLDWMPIGHNRLLIVSDWSTYPPDQFHVFNTIRRGCGVPEPLIDAPGHLFVSTKQNATAYDDRPQLDVEEESIAMWLVALMLEWTWEGWVFVKGCWDAIWLGDGFIKLFTSDSIRCKAGSALLAESGLKCCSSFPWQ